MARVKVIAPAKVNLVLGIGPKREDGFHDVDTVMHALLLHDTVVITSVPGKQNIGPVYDEVFLLKPATLADTENHSPLMENLHIGVSCVTHGGVEPLDVPTENNIVYKAAMELAYALQHTQEETIHIHIDKSIPHGGGLGGGSADAAATLVALCALWGVAVDDERVVRVAGELGADVAFFLQGGCARMSGKGEIFEAQLTPAKTSVVLVRPDQGVSTPQAYKTFDEDPEFPSDSLRERVVAAQTAQEAGLYNNLAGAAEKLVPELVEVREWLQAADGVVCDEQGCPQVLLCGSGSTTFALCEDAAHAYAIAAEAKKKGWWSRATNLSSVRAAVMR